MLYPLVIKDVYFQQKYLAKDVLFKARLPRMRNQSAMPWSYLHTMAYALKLTAGIRACVTLARPGCRVRDCRNIQSATCLGRHGIKDPL